MLVTELFLKSLIKLYDNIQYIQMVGHGILKHVVLWAVNTNYTYHLKRAIIERAMEYVKDRRDL